MEDHFTATYMATLSFAYGFISIESMRFHGNLSAFPIQRLVDGKGPPFMVVFTVPTKSDRYSESGTERQGL